jgi:hypothetical protein
MTPRQERALRYAKEFGVVPVDSTLSEAVATLTAEAKQSYGSRRRATLETLRDLES